MKFRHSLVILGMIALAAGLLMPGVTRAQTLARAQTLTPSGVVAFVGVNDSVDGEDTAALYLLNLASGKIGLVDIPVLPSVDFQWQPENEVLAFTTADGGYALLRSLRGCFDADATCLDLIEVYPPFMVEGIAWDATGEMLYLRTDEGLQLSPPRARPADITALATECDAGFALAATSQHLFCAATDSIGNTLAAVYAFEDDTFTPLSEIGTFPALTAYAIAADGSVAIGTEESAGDSGFFAPIEGAPVRLSPYQIRVYDLAAQPENVVFAIAGATADATGDGTLRDGDPGELFLFDTETLALNQQTGFTGATALAWNPSGTQLLVVSQTAAFKLFAPETATVTPLNLVLPENVITIPRLAWSAVESGLPSIPTATPADISTALPTPTLAVTLTPFPSVTPLPTLTPYTTFTPYPTFTPLPSTTPGSPMGTACEYAYAGGGGLPFAVGDKIAVTNYGAAVRLRNSPALTATMLAELLPGTTMTVISGPYCSQGYRWWQVKLDSNATLGYVADSDSDGLWVQYVETIPAEAISFYASSYSINPGNCVTVGWDVEGIKAVYYENAGVTGHETRQECPTISTTYTLRVVRLDNTEVTKQFTVFVVAP